MARLGRPLRGVRAGAHRSPLARRAFNAPASITVTSPAFTDGGAMPPSSAGKGVGDNASPPLRWDGPPPDTRQLVLVIDDIDVPLPRPLLHTVAVIEPGIAEVAAGALQPGTPGIRFLRADLGHHGYAGPRPPLCGEGVACACPAATRRSAPPWPHTRWAEGACASLLLGHLALDLVEPDARGHVRRGAPIAAR